jgi:RimJ/RimL family protein N-acetyltransferase
LPGFRGRGIYGYAISKLLQLAKDQGVRRVFMKTAADNTASQSGIEKAGLVRVGSATLIVLPVTQRTVTLRHFK